MPLSGEIIEATDVGPDAGTAWVPVLSASTTPPSLGSGGNFTQSGLWWRNNKTVVANGRFRFGTTSPSAGSGTYSVSLPTAASSTMTASGAIGVGMVIGSCILRDDSSTGSSIPGILQLSTTTTAIILLSTGNTATEARPWAWAASDALSFQVLYLID